MVHPVLFLCKVHFSNAVVSFTSIVFLYYPINFSFIDSFFGFRLVIRFFLLSGTLTFLFYSIHAWFLIFFLLLACGLSLLEFLFYLHLLSLNNHWCKVYASFITRVNSSRYILLWRFQPISTLIIFARKCLMILSRVNCWLDFSS